MPKDVTLPFTVLRRSGAEQLNAVRYNQHRIIITNYGVAVGAIISMEDLALLKSLKNKK